MKHKKFIVTGVIVLAVVLIISALSNSTYALFSSDDYGANPNVYSTGTLSIEAKSKSEVISLNNVLPMSDKEGKESTPYVFTIKNTGTVGYKFNVKLLSTGNSSTSFSPSYIKLQIDEGDVTTLSDLTSSKIKEDVVLAAGENIDISIRIWLDEETPNSEIGKSFNSKIVIDGQSVYTAGTNLVDYITSLYTPNDTAENNGITYNLDTTHYLMNDRLGTDSIGIDNGNIRYYGATPNNYIDIGDHYTQDFVINNWEKFGAPSQEICYSTYDCSVAYEGLGFSDEATCNANLPTILKESFGVSTLDEVCGTTTLPAGTSKLYRIIGLFKNVELADGTKKDLVKVVRNESIGNYSWDTSSDDVENGNGINEWSQADLMKLLNPEYSENTELFCVNDTGLLSCNNEREGLVNNSLWWNSESGMCYRNTGNRAGPCDFTNTGLNSNVHDKIEEVYWYLGGNDSTSVFPNQIYEYERGENVIQDPEDGITRTTKWKGKVALMYPSDYGYGTNLKLCQEALSDYYFCYQNDWLYNGMNKWLLTPNSSSTIYVWAVYGEGDGNNTCISWDVGVFPVFYLDSSLGIVTGDGSFETPFVVQ